MPIDAVGNDFSAKNLEIKAGEQQIAQVKAQKLPAMPADSVHFSGREEDKKSSNKGLTALSLLALAGLGILFRKNISKFLGIGKKAAVKGAKETAEAAASKAKDLAGNAATVFSNSSKTAKEALAAVADDITKEIGKVKSRTSSLIHNKRQKTLEQVFSEDNWKKYQSVLEAKTDVMKEAGERYARSFDNNADKFKDVMKKMFG